MDERQFQQVLELLEKIKRSLMIIQLLAGITLGFLLAVSFSRIF